ncbi:MAG: response regulator [archaeon]
MADLIEPQKTIEILLVDDEECVGDLALDFLSNLTNVKVIYFRESKLALEHILATEKKYDLIITDYNMPHKNGAELLADIRKLGIEKEIEAYKMVFQQSMVITAKKKGDSDSIFEYNDKQTDLSLRVPNENIVAKPFEREKDYKLDAGHNRKENLSHTLVYRAYKLLTGRGYQVNVAEDFKR